MYEVTIAIPLYNAEFYIEKTMFTAFAQTFNSIEFLIVDDHGTDSSLAIVQRLQHDHPRGKDIRIISHEHNQGVAAARNTAIREAAGKYLFFLDSDDLITPTCIEVLYNAIENQEAEIAIASHRHVQADTGKEKLFLLPSLSAHEPDRLASLRFGELHHVLGFYIWNILYRLSFIREKGLEFRSLHIGEDIVFMYEVIPEVESFVLVPDITYSYILRPNSLSQHGKRETIPLSEIEEQIAIRTHGKRKFNELKKKPYAADMITNLMKYSFEAASYIIDSRHKIVPRLPRNALRELLGHPLTLTEIRQLRNHKGANLFYYIGSKLPYWMTIPLLICFIQALKLSWKLRALRH